MFKYISLVLLCVGCGNGNPQLSISPQYVPTTTPNLLTLGDSITGGWNLPLNYILKNYYNVIRVTAETDPTSWLDNCRNTTYTLQNLDMWLKMWPNNKVIIWNNGIWNASQNVTPGQNPAYYYTPPAQYESEIQQIAAKLLAVSPRVIFLTTTALNPNDTRATVGLNTQFNDIAKRVLPPMGVEVHDLWDFTIDHPEWHISNTDLHFNGLAVEYIADWIAQFLGVTLQ